MPKVSDEPNPLGVLACAEHVAKELTRKGLSVESWIVIDAESYEDEERRQYRRAIDRASSKKVRVANSSPCFEYWLLLHYVPGIKVYTPSEAVGELSRQGRIPAYKKPQVPFSELWKRYESGCPSLASRHRREEIADLGEDPVFARPVTFVDELVDALAAMDSLK